MVSVGIYTPVLYRNTGVPARVAMADEYVMEDPDVAGKKEISDGRLWLGKEYNGKTVSFAVRVIDEDENEEVTLDL